jgi:hypothetical protein
MARIIVTGQFASEPQAARAVEKLLRACVGGEQVRAFFVQPADAPRRMPARRIETPNGREPARRTTAIELDFGPAASDGIQVSAYAQSVLMERSFSDTRGVGSAPRHAAILIAVETSDFVTLALAENVMRQFGASAIERSRAPRKPHAGFAPIPLASLLEHGQDRGPSNRYTLH